MESSEITGLIADSAIQVHTELGPGLLESAYEACMLFELHDRGLKAEAQVELPLTYKSVNLDVGYRLDLLVEDSIIVELKSVDTVLPRHKAQLLSYLKLSGYKVGLLLNFNVTHMRDGNHRLIY